MPQGTKAQRSKKPGARLSNVFQKPLILPHPHGGTIAVRPPSHDDGLVLAALYSHMADISIGMFKGEEPDKCPECGQYTRDSARPEVQEAFEANKDRQIEEVALGKDVYDQLIADGVSAADIHTLGIYTTFYWILGEESAEAYLDKELGEGDTAAPKA